MCCVFVFIDRFYGHLSRRIKSPVQPEQSLLNAHLAYQSSSLLDDTSDISANNEGDKMFAQVDGITVKRIEWPTIDTDKRNPIWLDVSDGRNNNCLQKLQSVLGKSECSLQLGTHRQHKFSAHSFHQAVNFGKFRLTTSQWEDSQVKKIKSVSSWIAIRAKYITVEHNQQNENTMIYGQIIQYIDLTIPDWSTTHYELAQVILYEPCNFTESQPELGVSISLHTPVINMKEILANQTYVQIKHIAYQIVLMPCVVLEKGVNKRKVQVANKSQRKSNTNPANNRGRQQQKDLSDAEYARELDKHFFKQTGYWYVTPLRIGD
jgi:hypothetical protein